ncbi:tRNA (guanine-N(7)-)-methyltransferase non-catalytic subunit wdr4 [Bacillus rossius redtenbacheri]|uniref:tRNA (guanine-N(7)-)-methyltransferase non-catalytic subunit wdr4 n=1 Tax=Bacillus rossius redtenbacheri TaxID=93214 RepID=UPI002FDD10C0
MVVLATSKNYFVTCSEHILGVDSTKKECRVIECRSLFAKNLRIGDKSTGDGAISVDCAALSSCGRFLVVCCNKNMCLLKTSQWCVVSVRQLARVANSVKFTASGRQLVVADRSGDAYVYSVAEAERPGELLLGHTSMLVDVLVTACERFVITCDRDEKIRVSNFPNAYNIHSFCLGHEKFVSCIAELPHDASVLISGSGDGTVRFWDYFSGTEICAVTDGARSAAALLSSAPESCDEGESLPIRCFSWFKKDSESSVGCACVGGLLDCLIFRASGGRDTLSVVILQTISLQSEPWVASFSDSGVLWVLQQAEGKTACAFTLNTDTGRFEGNRKLDDDSEYVLNTVNSKWELFSSQEPPKVLSILYKRIFDDIQEYHDRKKARLLSKTKNV